jgi:predicted phosphohydrolase
MRIVCISDTHGLHDQVDVPPGDILIHAGDLTRTGDLDDVVLFSDWLGQLPHRHKIVIAGNHDWAFERQPERARALLLGCIYLEDQETTVEGLRIWGSPWQPWFFDWAFNLERGPEIRAKWDLIPEGIDLLITHGPPRGQGDWTINNEAAGCVDLLDAVARVRPRWHVFGHIHEGYGISEADGTTFINASICTVGYQPTNKPIVFDVG